MIFIKFFKIPYFHDISRCTLYFSRSSGNIYNKVFQCVPISDKPSHLRRHLPPSVHCMLGYKTFLWTEWQVWKNYLFASTVADGKNGRKVFLNMKKHLVPGSRSYVQFIQMGHPPPKLYFPAAAIYTNLPQILCVILFHCLRIRTIAKVWRQLRLNSASSAKYSKIWIASWISWYCRPPLFKRLTSTWSRPILTVRSCITWALAIINLKYHWIGCVLPASVFPSGDGAHLGPQKCILGVTWGIP